MATGNKRYAKGDNPNFTRKIDGKVYRQQSSNSGWGDKRHASNVAEAIRRRHNVNARVVTRTNNVGQKRYWVVTRRKK
jgi:hypothetical protein